MQANPENIVMYADIKDMKQRAKISETRRAIIEDTKSHDPSFKEYIDKTIAPLCDEEINKMKHHCDRGGFSVFEHKIDAKKYKGNQTQCDNISHFVSARFPGFGVTVDKWESHCRINILHNKTPNFDSLTLKFGKVKSGCDETKEISVYAGPEKSNCQKIADRLNALNSIFSPTQVVCRTYMITGMCHISMQKWTLSERLSGFFSKF